MEEGRADGKEEGRKAGRKSLWVEGRWIPYHLQVVVL